MEELTHQVVLLALGCILGVPVLLPVSLLEVSAGAAGTGVAVARKDTPSPATASGPELLLKRRRQSRPESEGPACQFAGGGGFTQMGKEKGKLNGRFSLPLERTSRTSSLETTGGHRLFWLGSTLKKSLWRERSVFILHQSFEIFRYIIFKQGLKEVKAEDYLKPEHETPLGPRITFGHVH